MPTTEDDYHFPVATDLKAIYSLHPPSDQNGLSYPIPNTVVRTVIILSIPTLAVSTTLSVLMFLKHASACCELRMRDH